MLVSRNRVLALVVAVLALVACSSASSTTTASSGSGASGTAASAPPLTGPLTVFAAASLTEAFNAEKTTLEAANPGLSITYSFAGSGALVQQVQADDTVADVIATADTSSMQKLTDAGLVETPTTFAENQLEILVQPGNPKNIETINDLARPDVVFVTEDPSVPAGRYTAAMFAQAGITVNPVSMEPDVKSAVAKVTSGQADATVVYVTDVKAAGSKGEGVPIPDSQNQIASYPIAIVKATKHHDAAAGFVAAMTTGGGQDALAASGFLPAS